MVGGYLVGGHGALLRRLMAGLCPACSDLAPRTAVRDNGEGDAEALALGLDFRQLGRRRLGAFACLASCALMGSQLASNSSCAAEKIGSAGHHGSGAAVCMIRRPKRSSSLAAAEDSSAMNSISRPDGLPFANAGLGLAFWKQTGTSYCPLKLSP